MSKQLYIIQLTALVATCVWQLDAQKPLATTKVQPVQEVSYTPAIQLTSPATTAQTVAPAQPDAPVERILKPKDKRKHKTKKGTQRKLTMREMNFEQLKERKNKLLAHNDKEMAIVYLEKMMPLSKDMHVTKELIIELADLHFDMSQYTQAFKLYTEFSKLYPGNQSVEHASYRAIVCSFKQILAATKDQSKTKETVELAQKFLERADVFTTHKDQVKEIESQCYARLRESEENIINYYTTRGSYKAAANRITHLRKDQLEKFPESEKVILVLEKNLAQQQNNLELVAKLETELVTKFPEQPLQLAQGKKVNFMDKF